MRLAVNEPLQMRLDLLQQGSDLRPVSKATISASVSIYYIKVIIIETIKCVENIVGSFFSFLKPVLPCAKFMKKKTIFHISMLH